MDSIVIQANPEQLRARRDRALASVRLTEGELCARIDAGDATPEECDAWQEVDTVRFLMVAFDRSAVDSRHDLDDVFADDDEDIGRAT